MISNITYCEQDVRSISNPEAELQINASITRYLSNYVLSYRSDFLNDYDPNNHLTILDEDLNPIAHLNLVPEDGNPAFEDLRLFVYQEKLMALYTYLPRTTSGWLWENGIAIGEVNIQTGVIERQQSLRFLKRGVHEKNYVPLVDNGQLYLVAEFDPELRIIKVNGSSGNFSFFESNLSPKLPTGWKFGQIRGGTPFLKFKDHWHYSFVHSSVMVPNGNFESRYYFYTALRLSIKTGTVEIAKLPMGFSKYENRSVETPEWLTNSKRNLPIKVVFPMGIVPYQEGVVISYGQDDCISKLKFYSKDYIINAFK